MFRHSQNTYEKGANPLGLNSEIQLVAISEWPKPRIVETLSNEWASKTLKQLVTQIETDRAESTDILPTIIQDNTMQFQDSRLVNQLIFA